MKRKRKGSGIRKDVMAGFQRITVGGIRKWVRPDVSKSFDTRAEVLAFLYPLKNVPEFASKVMPIPPVNPNAITLDVEGSLDWEIPGTERDCEEQVDNG